MKITRRAALTGLAASSLLPLIEGCGRTKVQADSVAHVNIILHGLFFMRFIQKKLIVHAPIHSAHKLFFATNGFLVPVPPGHEFDLTMPAVKLSDKGTVQDFTKYPQIPQFSIGAVNVGDFTSHYYMRLVLPRPETIIPLRKGKLDEFGSVSNMSTSGKKIAKTIYEACRDSGKNNDLALVTCLRYAKSDSFGAPPNATWIFYAEHDNRPKKDDVNAALLDVDRSSFFTNKVFDLGFTAESVFQVCQDKQPGYGIAADDENTLFEITQNLPCSSNIEGTDVVNCVQFGVNG